MSEELKSVSVEPGRLQSPSSIILYKQCPRKYFYKYIAKLPSPRSIHLVRGSIAHKVMEDVYDLDTHIDLATIPDDSFLITIKFVLQEMFRKEWDQNLPDLRDVGLTDEELKVYYDDTRVMINNFFHYLVDRMQLLQVRGMSVKEAFLQIKPRREVELHSFSHHVRGFADAIHLEDGKLVIIDYKTSRKLDMTDEYRLQLGIYSMIYEEMERLPDEVGIFFLKHGQELRIPVTRALVEMAREECNAIHINTRSKNIKDYHRNVTGLCKWSTGQCEFYETCFSPTLGEYDADQLVQLGLSDQRGDMRFARERSQKK